MDIAGGLRQRSIVENQTLLGAGGHVKTQMGGVTGRQTGEPRVPGALEVDRQALTVGAGVTFRTFTSVGGGRGVRRTLRVGSG